MQSSLDIFKINYGQSMLVLLVSFLYHVPSQDPLLIVRVELQNIVIYCKSWLNPHNVNVVIFLIVS